MAIVGTKTDNSESVRGYEHDSMHGTAQAYNDLAVAAKNESGIDLSENPREFLKNSIARDSLRKYFVENSYDPKDPRFLNNEEAVNEHLANMSAIFDNDCDGIMTESTALGAFAPVVGMALPIHKNILMTASFDQAIPKDVARSPKFTLSLETRNMIDTKGNVIDMYAEQNLIKTAIDESIPTIDHLITLPEQENTDWISLMETEGKYTFDKTIANLSIRTKIAGILIGNVFVPKGGQYYDVKNKKVAIATEDGPQTVLFHLDAHFTPGYGEHENQMHSTFMLQFKKDANTNVTVTGTIMGFLRSDTNRMVLQTMPLKINDGTTEVYDKQGTDAAYPISGLMVRAVLDVSSAAFPTVRVDWKATTKIFQIPEAPHITMPITPEMAKDINALYDVNQVTKYMSMMRLSLLHWTDDTIHERLNDSYLGLPANHQYKCGFDFAPPMNFNGTPVEWRTSMFMDRFETMITEMLQELNDENMTIVAFGRPDLIRRLAPQSVSYQTPPNIGPVELDFSRTVVTTGKRVYNFVSAQKMRGLNYLIVLLIPRNTMRITYKKIEYQMYLSNEIRDTRNYQLPSLTAFNRWMFLQFQPVQGRCIIKNYTGLRENPESGEYVSVNAMNDWDANRAAYASEVNGVIDDATGSFKIPPIKTDGGGTDPDKPNP